MISQDCMYSIYVSISQENSSGTYGKSHSVYITHLTCPVYRCIYVVLL